MLSAIFFQWYVKQDDFSLSEVNQNLVTKITSHAGSHGARGMCETSTWSAMFCSILWKMEPPLCSQWESASNRTRTQISPLDIKLFGTYPPSNPYENEFKEDGLCGLIFPCVQLHACLGGDAGVVTGLQRWAGRWLSVSLGCGLCGWAAVGISWRPAPPGSAGTRPLGSKAPSTIIPMSSPFLASFVF